MTHEASSAPIRSPVAFALMYGMQNVGMDYDRSLFGMKLSDCRSLAKSLERTETLTYLNLSNNLLDDDKVRGDGAASLELPGGNGCVMHCYSTCHRII